MNPFLLAPAERLRNWRDFRLSLASLGLEAQLQALASYWSRAPVGTLAYDPCDASGWLSPWELLHHNQWCRSSVAIGMEHTLRLAGTAAERLRLQLIRDDLHDALLVSIVDATHVLNYDWGRVHKVPLQKHKVIQQWRFAERGYYTA